MDNFKHLFGMPAEDIHPICVLTPFLHKNMLADLNISSWCKGRPYSSGHSKHFTLVHTQIGSVNVGDAVLYLKDSPCKQVIFIGACGLAFPDSSFEIGNIVEISCSYNFESFSQILNKTARSEKINPINIFSDNNNLNKISKVTAASFGSLRCEENFLDVFKKHGITVLDMETSAFFSAANFCQMTCAALAYITDILGHKHVFRPYDSSDQQSINQAQADICKLILKLTKDIA